MEAEDGQGPAYTYTCFYVDLAAIHLPSASRRGAFTHANKRKKTYHFDEARS
jgi:hypothetical protein